MKKLAIGMVLAAICGMAQAETYYLSQNANTISPFTSSNLGNYWTKSFTLKTYLINGVSNYTNAQITEAFREICHVNGEVNQGLYNRRTLEAQLFLTSVEGEGEDKYTITFDPNGGTLTSGNSSYTIS